MYLYPEYDHDFSQNLTLTSSYVHIKTFQEGLVLLLGYHKHRETDRKANVPINKNFPAKAITHNECTDTQTLVKFAKLY